jgi:rapamycin-insensitive companion of mTOR
MRRGQRQVEQAKIKAGMQIDDKSFQAILLEAQVSIIVCAAYIKLTLRL